jgi:hypothetical protein
MTVKKQPAAPETAGAETVTAPAQSESTAAAPAEADDNPFAAGETPAIEVVAEEELDTAPKNLTIVDTETGEARENSNIAVVPTIMGTNQFAQIYAASQSLEEKQHKVSIVPDYFEFTQEGQTTKGVFIGYQVIHKKVTNPTTNEVSLAPINCVAWMSAGKSWINGGVVIYNEFKAKELQPGTSFELTYKGKKGNAKIFDVAVLF